MPDCLFDEDLLDHTSTSSDWLSYFDTHHHMSSSYASSPTSMEHPFQAVFGTDHMSAQLCPLQHVDAPHTGMLDCEHVSSEPSWNIPLADQANYHGLSEGSGPAHANSVQCSYQHVLSKHALHCILSGHLLHASLSSHASVMPFAYPEQQSLGCKTCVYSYDVLTKHGHMGIAVMRAALMLFLTAAGVFNRGLTCTTSRHYHWDQSLCHDNTNALDRYDSICSNEAPL